MSKSIAFHTDLISVLSICLFVVIILLLVDSVPARKSFRFDHVDAERKLSMVIKSTFLYDNLSEVCNIAIGWFHPSVFNDIRCERLLEDVKAFFRTMTPVSDVVTKRVVVSRTVIGGVEYSRNFELISDNGCEYYLYIVFVLDDVGEGVISVDVRRTETKIDNSNTKQGFNWDE